MPPFFYAYLVANLVYINVMNVGWLLLRLLLCAAASYFHAFFHLSTEIINYPHIHIIHNCIKI
jgi:hypothetical protein